jgi:hypothetical protein
MAMNTLRTESGRPTGGRSKDVLAEVRKWERQRRRPAVSCDLIGRAGARCCWNWCFSPRMKGVLCSFSFSHARSVVCARRRRSYSKCLPSALHDYPAIHGCSPQRSGVRRVQSGARLPWARDSIVLQPLSEVGFAPRSFSDVLRPSRETLFRAPAFKPVRQRRATTRLLSNPLFRQLHLTTNQCSALILHGYIPNRGFHRRSIPVES